MSEEYHIDYRFFVKAESWEEFIGKIVEFLPEATDEIWYTEINADVFTVVTRPLGEEE